MGRGGLGRSCLMYSASLLRRRIPLRMGNVADRLKEVLLVCGLYEQVRRLNWRGRHASKARAEMRQFFASLLPKGALVFDIGANTGTFSEAFASAGARVVAVEPYSQSARHIQLMYANRNIQVIQAAIGASNGLAELNIADWHANCTLSSEYIDKMKRLLPNNWSRGATVPVLTLDTLVHHFGEPHFIKIDVEGYEREVLRGLSTQPPLLSFEFHNALLSSALECLDLPLWVDGSTFNLIDSSVWGYHSKFKFAKWMNKEAICEVLMSLTGEYDQGDIYVRRPGTLIVFTTPMVEPVCSSDDVQAESPRHPNM